MSPATTLTDGDIEAIEGQIAYKRMLKEVASPVPPAPDSWEGQKVASDERKRQARIAAHRAEEERQAQEREREAEQARKRWEKNAKRRERARAQLYSIDSEINTLRARLDELSIRRRGLVEEANE